MEQNFSPEDKIRLLCGKGNWHTNDLDGKIPSLCMTDGPHGLRKEKSEGIGQNNLSVPATCFPTASAIACSFDPTVAARMAKAIAEEAIAENVDIVLGPGINIKRSPLCGRNFEYYSEDPFLSGKLGTSYIKSMQAEGIGTSLKHFAGNSQETHRQTANSEIDERALREIYLSAFEMAVKEANPETIMASYNRINGYHACTNKSLLTEILREEWGYQGAVISDWGAVTDIVACIKAGMDLEMPDSDGIHTKKLLDAYKKGKLSEQEIDRAFQNLLNLLKKHPHGKNIPVCDRQRMLEEHHKLATSLCEECAVLLQNDGFLPLLPSHFPTIVVIGELSVHMRYQGGGSSHINATHLPNAVESLTEAGFHVLYTQGYENNTEKISSKLEQEALHLAAQGYPVLFFGGLTENFEGEGYDRTTLSLPQNQIHLFEKLKEVTHDIAFVSFGGSAMDLAFAKDAKAILHMYLGGQGVADACANLISGKHNPSGRLAETFPLSITDVPSYCYFGTDSDDVEYRESIYVGYRYYESCHKPVLFPFGHGLSYTTFEYSNLSLSLPLSADNIVYKNGQLPISVTIKNTGHYAGSEVVQIYVKNPSCNYLRPSKELRGFQKIYLEPGESKRITISLQERSFSLYDTDNSAFLMPSGIYKILCGASIQDIRLEKELVVDGTTYIRNDREKLPSYFNQIHNQVAAPISEYTDNLQLSIESSSLQISQNEFAALYKKELSHFDKDKKNDFTTYHSLAKLSKHSFLGKLLLGFSNILVFFTFKGKSKNSPEVKMMRQGIREGTLESIFCQSGGMIPYRIAEAIVLSANGKHWNAFCKLFH